MSIHTISRFDRKEVFDNNLLDHHQDTIHEMQLLKCKADKADKDFYRDIINKLFGLYDGFLYTDLYEIFDNDKLPLEVQASIFYTLNRIEFNSPESITYCQLDS